MVAFQHVLPFRAIVTARKKNESIMTRLNEMINFLLKIDATLFAISRCLRKQNVTPLKKNLTQNYQALLARTIYPILEILHRFAGWPHPVVVHVAVHRVVSQAQKHVKFAKYSNKIRVFLFLFFFLCSKHVIYLYISSLQICNSSSVS